MCSTETVWQLNSQKIGKRGKAKGEEIKKKIKEKNKIKEEKYLSFTDIR